MSNVRQVGRHITPNFGGLKLGKVLFSGEGVAKFSCFASGCANFPTFLRGWGGGGC